MRVVIDAGGRRVEVETLDQNVTPDQITSRALAIWLATESGAGPRVGLPGALGYRADAAPTRDREPVGGWGYIRPVKAGNTDKELTA